MMLPLLVLLTACASRPSSPPNLVIVSLGTPKTRAPSAFLDAQARKGTRFSSAWPESDIAPFSWTAILTGRHVPEVAAADADAFTLPAAAVLVSEVLGYYGYTTGAYGIPPGFSQGFSVFHPECADACVPGALDWIDQRAREPFLLVVGLPDADPTRSDAQADALVEGLDDRDLLDRTLLVLTAPTARPTDAAEGPLPDAPVPLVVRGPGIAAGVDRADPVHAIDLLPTLLEVAAATPPAGIQGRSLLAPPVERPLFQVGDHVLAMRDAQARLVFSGPPSTVLDMDLALEAAPLDARWFRYDLLTTAVRPDPLDAHTAQMRDALLAWHRKLVPDAEVRHADPALLEQLRQHGYW